MNRSSYQPLNTAQLLQEARRKTSNKPVTQGFQNAPKSFDVGFREILRRNDLDVFFNGALDKDALEKAQYLLSTLCQQLERIVNPGILESASSVKDDSTTGANGYQKLDSLIETLNKSKWRFEIITGAAPKLFRIRSLSEVERARDMVDNFNSYFSRLTRPTLSEARPLHGVDLLESARATLAQDKHATALRALTALLRKLKKLPNCPRCHDVLLQLADWQVGHSEESMPAPLDTNFDLFLSICRMPGKISWQQCYFHPLLPLYVGI